MSSARTNAATQPPPDTYIAVIGDIVHSREITNRRRFQDELAQSLAQISSAQQEGIASPWTVTLGDEMQALYRDAGSLIPALWRIQQGIYPHHIRFSLGIGRIDTRINREAALGMDGPAFHLAREGMEALKDDEQRYFAIRPATAALQPAEHLLNLAALAIHGGRGRARLDLVAELLSGRSPTQIGGADPGEVRRLQKLRQQSGLQIVVDALENVAHVIAASCRQPDSPQ